jgi:hypothetical protein
VAVAVIVAEADGDGEGCKEEVQHGKLAKSNKYN